MTLKVTTKTSTENCGCPENNSLGLTRRGMFQLAGAAGVTIATTMSQARVAIGAPGTKNRVLVVVSLRGGMDGLSLVAPVSDPAYIAARPDIGVTSKVGLKLDQSFALHPALSPLLPLWKSRQLAIVHATGLPNPERSHFKAMAEMEIAAPGSSLRTGWIDRLIGLEEAPEIMAATNVGNSRVPQALRGPDPTIGLTNLNSVGLKTSPKTASLSAWRESIKALHAEDSGKLAAPIEGAFNFVEKIGGKPEVTEKSGAAYPDSELGKSLADVARLIRMDVGVQVATVDKGNWDMHAALGTVEEGWMKDQATDLAQSLAAFAKDLGADLDRVTLITLSEFGRRVSQNGSGGLDHGYGNAAFILGGGVNGGKVYGKWPGLGEEDLIQGDLAVTTDYRAILAELISDRLSVSDMKSIFPDYQPANLGLVRA